MYNYIIDSHSHLDGDEFDEDRNEVIARAKEVGVKKVLLPCINYASLPKLMSVYKEQPDFFSPMIGLHPEDIKEGYIQELELLREVLEKDTTKPIEQRDFIAIGEVGLDFYWDKTFTKEQIDAFEIQIEWAAKYNLPLMIHSRNAHEVLVKTIKGHKHQNLRGVFHCFSGTTEEAEELLAFKGFKLGIGGVLTFKKSKLPATLKEVVPLDRIVLETDAPYLSPVPYRGKRNESSFIISTAKKLAEIYECSTEEIIDITTKNVLETFKLQIDYTKSL